MASQSGPPVTPEERSSPGSAMLIDDKTETPELAQQRYQEIKREADKIVHHWVDSFGPAGASQS